MSKWVSKILEFHSILSNLFGFSLVSPFVFMKNEQMSMWRILIWVQWFRKFGKCHWLSGVKQTTIFNYRQIVMNAYQMRTIEINSNFFIFSGSFDDIFQTCTWALNMFYLSRTTFQTILELIIVYVHDVYRIHAGDSHFPTNYTENYFKWSRKSKEMSRKKEMKKIETRL